MSEFIYLVFSDTKVGEFSDICKFWGTYCSPEYYKNV